MSRHARIREAVSADASFLSDIILTSARSHETCGIWDLVFPDSEQQLRRLLETLVVQKPACSCHYSTFLIAESAGRPAAALCGYDPEEVVGICHALALGFERLGVEESELVGAFERLASFQTCSPDQTPGVWIVEWVATRPEFRRPGLAHSLLEEILWLGKELDYPTAQIATFIENEPAIRAYEKAGFQISEQRTHPAFDQVIGSQGMSIMKLDFVARFEGLETERVGIDVGPTVHPSYR